MTEILLLKFTSI